MYILKIENHKKLNFLNIQILLEQVPTYQDVYKYILQSNSTHEVQCSRKYRKFIVY